MRASLALVAAATALLTLPAGGLAERQRTDAFSDVVALILSRPYQPAYTPLGLDQAFPMDADNPLGVPNTFPAGDYTSGSIPGSPDHPNWPTAYFAYKTKADGLQGFDGAPLRGYLGIHPGGPSPGILVVHGFNTNGKESVVRWATMLYARGYNVLAADQRDFKDESDHGEGYPHNLQTFGWKEAQDVLAAGAWLKSRPGVGDVGVVGFSEGAQNTILALAGDTTHVFAAGLTFSGPADQNWQIYSTAQPPNCVPPSCQYPATDALITLVVPPYGSGGKYTDPCQVLNDDGAHYGSSPSAILGQERAFRAQASITAPLLNFYADDDSLVDPRQATMMAGYETGKPLQRTYLVAQGEHAYFFDRAWQQQATLIYFGGLLTGAPTDVSPTVNAGVPAGPTFGSQLVDLGSPTPAEADALFALAPMVCPGPTAVTLRSLTAMRSGASVVFSWRTASEAGVAGFELYRGSARVTSWPIAARSPAAGGSYRVVLAAARAGVYRLEAVGLDGRRTLLARARVPTANAR